MSLVRRWRERRGIRKIKRLGVVPKKEARDFYHFRQDSIRLPMEEDLVVWDLLKCRGITTFTNREINGKQGLRPYEVYTPFNVPQWHSRRAPHWPEGSKPCGMRVRYDPPGVEFYPIPRP